MLLKSRIQQEVDTLEDEVELDDFLQKLYIIEKIEKANLQSINREVISHDTVKLEVEKWFK